MDVGDKRIGIAFSEPGLNIALPFETYHRKVKAADVKYIAELAKKRQADLIVCGLPLNADGTDSIQTIKTRSFVLELQKLTDIKIEFEDERYTSIMAEDILIESGMRREKRKEVIDKVAASYILESYLNKNIKSK